MERAAENDRIAAADSMRPADQRQGEHQAIKHDSATHWPQTAASAGIRGQGRRRIEQPVDQPDRDQDEDQRCPSG